MAIILIVDDLSAHRRFLVTLLRGQGHRTLEAPDGRRAHPTAEHWLPILYAVGAADEGDTVRFPITGFDLGSLSMRAVLFG